MTARKSKPVLVVLSGLPGVGKTTVARRVSSAVGAVHVRLDTIEAALTASGVVDRAGGWAAVPDAGYRVAYAVTADFLTAGRDVVADSVNPLAVTRQAWADTARAAEALLIEVEVICSDRELHRRRVESRSSDIAGLTVPTWQQVEARAYEPWNRQVLRVDTAAGIEQATDTVVAAFMRGQATIAG
ncbi:MULTISPECIES: AAA family ATPase [unclassified Mycolicibacterium]|uniref:AAA family ATPase n=1 Tax=unclassified Mycolicibacterium TaxID=2636767 RepID=UPI002ED7909F